MTTHKWATVLAAARHRRAPHMWPHPKQQTLSSPLVRPYVLQEDEAQAPTSPARENR